jgi:hypothetical protein
MPKATAEWPPCPLLREVVARRRVLLPNGEERDLVANIGSASSAALYQTVLHERPGVVIEVGMAQGISTLSILAALNQTGGRLISIDPYYTWPSARLAALYSVERAGFSAFHQHIQAPSYEALPHLLAQGISPQMGYIDGAHDFGNCFIDFFYLDLMLPVGGMIGFNDAGWLSVHRVIRFLEKHRHYAEQDVGLAASYTGRNVVVSAGRWLLRMPRQDRYFRKLQTSSANA